MATTLGDNISYGGQKPNFERDQFASLAAAKAFSSALLDVGHTSYMVAEGKHYVWNGTEWVDKYEYSKAIQATGGSMGYIVLSKDKTFAEQVTEPNTIYEIRYNFDLDNSEETTFELPSNSTLRFVGGRVTGFLQGQYTNIVAGLDNIFGPNSRLSGTWSSPVVYPEWFGAVGDGEVDDSAAMQIALSIEGVQVYLSKPKYRIEQKITVANNTSLCGNNICRLYYATDGACLELGQMTRVYNIGILVHREFAGTAIEISNKSFKSANAGIEIHSIVIDRENQGWDLYGTCFLMYAEANENAGKGLWNINLHDIDCRAQFKYFCINYTKPDAWFTRSYFRNITLNCCVIGFLGAPTEEEVEQYEDIWDAYFENITLQSSGNTKHLFLFTMLCKFVNNCFWYDWTSSTHPIYITENASVKPFTKLLISNTPQSPDDSIDIAGFERPKKMKALSDLVVVQEGYLYRGNRTDYNIAYREDEWHALGNFNPSTQYLKLDLAFSLKSSSIEFLLRSPYGRATMEIYVVNPGGDYGNSCFSCKEESGIRCWLKVTDEENNKFQILFDFGGVWLTQPNYVYLTYRVNRTTEGSTSVPIEAVGKSATDMTGFREIPNADSGTIIQPMWNRYHAYATYNGGVKKNRLMQYGNNVIYKTDNEIQEKIPKVRRGTVQLTANTPTQVTFTDLGNITNPEAPNDQSANMYEVITIPSNQEVTITQKTSTGFTIESATDISIRYLVITY